MEGHSVISPEVLARYAADAAAECASALPHVPRADIAHLIAHGIVGAQGDYQNNPESILGYGCLDGFAIPRTLMRITTLETRTLDTLELFTDGYFRPGETRGPPGRLAPYRGFFRAGKLPDRVFQHRGHPMADQVGG